MENNEPKKEKPVKVPGVFKKPIKEKKFQKRFVKYIEHPKDKQFLINCFNKEEDAYLIRKNLTKDDVKKLKNLLKWVKKNRKGPIKVVPLAFAGIVVAAIVIFFTVFANPLLEYALETGLEAIFEAKSDVDNLRLSILDFEISMEKITIANRDKPMTNLIEMLGTRSDRKNIIIKLKPQAVLRGKVYIERISAGSIRFGTERTVSGALPGKPPKEKKAKEKSDAPPLVDLKNFDAMALLEQEFDKLNTPKMYDEAVAVYNETVDKWKNQVDSAKTKAAELKTASQPLISLNVNNIRDLDTVRSTIQDINTMYNTVQSAADDVQNLVTGLESDINMAKALEQNARNAINNDLDHLKSYVDLSSGAAFAAIEPFIRDVLSDTAEEYLDYGFRALEVLELLKAQAAMPKTAKAEKPKKEEKIVFKGRDVNFPVVSYPKFYLGELSSDVTQGSWNGAFNLSNVSSDPNLTWKQTSKPISLDISANEISGSLARKIAFEGTANFMDNPPQRFTTLVTGGGFPVSLGDQLSKVGINGFAGETGFSVNMTGHNDGGVSAGGDVAIKQARIIDPVGTIAEASAAAVSKAGQINLGIQYIHHINSKDEFKITTNIASLLADALKNIAQAYAQKAIAEIEKALRAKIDQYIDGKFVSKEEVDLLLKSAKGDKAAVDQLKTSLMNKKNEFENKLKAAADQAVQQAKDEATKQAEQAAKDVLQGQTPTLKTPSLPSGGGLKLPGR